MARVAAPKAIFPGPAVKMPKKPAPSDRLRARAPPRSVAPQQKPSSAPGRPLRRACAESARRRLSAGPLRRRRSGARSRRPDAVWAQGSPAFASPVSRPCGSGAPGAALPRTAPDRPASTDGRRTPPPQAPSPPQVQDDRPSAPDPADACRPGRRRGPAACERAHGAGARAVLALGLSHPVAQRFARTTDCRCDRRDRGPWRALLILRVQRPSGLRGRAPRDWWAGFSSSRLQPLKSRSLRATPVEKPDAILPIVSIHAPARGATRGPQHEQSPIHGFDPCPRAGGDPPG